MTRDDDTAGCVAWHLRLGGRVQGVGFRPFVYRQAQRFALNGWVQNLGSEVAIHVEGKPPGVELFTRALLSEAPPLARPVLLGRRAVTPRHANGFSIRPSRGVRAADFHASLAQLTLRLAEKARERQAIRHIGLCGGVFQNRRLTEQSSALLQQHGFVVFTPGQVPGNDGGLAWGQIIEAEAARRS